MPTAPVIASERTTVHQGVAPNRIPAFDFTKGVLVLFMVFYHWLNYYYAPYGLIYKYLRFLTPSFIFITGFLISHVHFSKYGIGSVKLSKRLFARGVKLLATFIALNLIISLVMPSSFIRGLFAGHSIASNLDSVFLTARISNTEGDKAASFGILVPISYLLMITALLSPVCRKFRYTFHVACAILLIVMVILSLYGIQSANVELVAIGLFGVILGYASADRIQTIVNRPWVIVTAYCTYLVAITIWDVSPYVQMIGACLTTALIYWIGVKTEGPSRLRGLILLLGRYSLFGYISQIAILRLQMVAIRIVVLRLMQAGARISPPGYAMIGATLVSAVILTVLSVEVVDRFRRKSSIFDGCYRAIFA